MGTTTPRSEVLILDGDDKNASLLASRLTQQGVPATHITNPAEAIELCKRDDRFGLFLSEIWLPGKTGFEVATELRNEKISAPEIILMSHDPKISLFDCHQAGACYFLRKPINYDELGLAMKRFANLQLSASTAAQGPGDSTAALGRLYGQIRVSRQKHEVPVEVSNLGRGGFFAKTHAGVPLSVGQVVDFNLKLQMVPDCECTGRGIIRWNYQSTNAEESGVGVEFLKVPEWFQQVAFAFADLFKVKEYIPNS